MQATVLMLKNRAAVMGKIDSSNTEVDNKVGDKKTVTPGVWLGGATRTWGSVLFAALCYLAADLLLFLSYFNLFGRFGTV